jgi:hypothetical protein
MLHKPDSLSLAALIERLEFTVAHQYAHKVCTISLETATELLKQLKQIKVLPK